VKSQKIPICRYLDENSTKYKDQKDYVSKIQPFLCSTQGLAMIEKVTRLYLGKSASISQSIQKLNAPETGDNSYEADNGSGKV